jgi:hypothetical protein
VSPRALLTASVAAIVLGAPGCVVSVDHEGVIERDEKRFTAETTPDVHLITFDGAVEIRSWDRPEVVVHIERRGQDKDVVSKIEVLSSQKGNRIEVEARHSGRTTFVGIGVYRSPSARLVASVPRQANLFVRSGDGSITVERVSGRMELQTGDGLIRATETGGELLAETGDGSIQIEDITGKVEARTGDGSIRLSGTPSALRTRTGDGSIALRIRTGASMTDDWMVATGDGSVSVELPPGFNAQIEADPGSDGRVRNDLTLTSLAGGTRETRTLTGLLGQGGRRLTLRTGDGTIRLTSY